MAELTRFAEWNVTQAEIDHLGHMNMQFYARRADQGCARMLELLGLGPAALEAAAVLVAAIDQHTTFRREQLVGAPLRMDGGVCAADSESLTIYQEMHNRESGALAATFLSTVQLQDRARRARARVPDAIVAGAQAALVTPPSRNLPRSLPRARMNTALTMEDFRRAGIESHFAREIEAADCDADGFFDPAFRLRRLPQERAPKGQGVMDEVWGSIEGHAWPALEARTLTQGAARAGDVLLSYTALLSMTHKVIEWGTWTFEARTSRLMSVNQQANIFFDLAARRPQDIPPAHHARIAALAHPELAAKA